MLLYYPFWMFMGFTLHFYIIFGTNLLTGGPTRIVVFFLPISVFRRKGISNEIQTKWNLRDDLSWTESKPKDLEIKSEMQRGGHEAGGRALGGWARPHPCGPLVAPLTYLLRLYIYPHMPKTSRSTTKNYFHHRNLLYPRDPILEPFPALRRRGNRPWRASTSSPRPLRWVVSSLP